MSGHALVVATAAAGLVGILGAPALRSAPARRCAALGEARPPAADTRRGGARRRGLLGVAGLAVAAGVVLPPLAGVVVVAAWARRRRAVTRAASAAHRAVVDGLPDAVDLLVLCVGAGLSLPLAHPLVAARTPGPLGDALARADRAATLGRGRADALVEELGGLGERAAALGRVLTDHLRYGVPLGPGLDRLGLELRLERRRRAEEEARRVPVRLLAPLVTCTLPAFGLLTVVPLLVASLRSLPV